MTKILRRYFDEDLQHWVDVYEAEEDNHVPTIHVSYKHRMISAERKIRQTFRSIENSLRQEVRNFIKRRKF